MFLRPERFGIPCLVQICARSSNAPMPGDESAVAITYQDLPQEWTSSGLGAMSSPNHFLFAKWVVKVFFLFFSWAPSLKL